MERGGQRKQIKGGNVQPSSFKAQSCVEVEVDVLGSLSLIVRTVSVDAKQQ